MKKETKELVKWIRNHITMKAEETFVPYDNMRAQAEAFLDSLPEIESHLCRGGYIQDKNGKPCCEGDEVIYTEPSLPVAVRGVLNWNKNSGCFKIRHSIGTILGPLNISRLEKVK